MSTDYKIWTEAPSPLITRRACLLLLPVVALLVGCRRQAHVESEVEETVVAVAARPAQVGSLRTVLHLSGVVTTAPGGELLVVAPEPAQVLEVLKAQGDMVSPGEALVRFDLPGATQEVARQRAEVAQLQAQLENARAAQARMRDLVDRGFVPRRDMDGVDREHADTLASLTRANTAMAAADASAGRAIVRASFAGVVAQRLHNPGDVVRGIGDPVLRIVDPRRLEIDAAVPAADMVRVQPGATARLAGAVPIRLSVLAREAVSGGPSGTARVRLAFADTAGATASATAALAVDTPVQVDIDAEERLDIVFVPAESIVRNGQDAAVLVAVGTMAQRRSVTTGVENDDRVEIVSGVKAGELV
ncbi:MAG: efflux RND transporter periplasmic adaptor subunit, partial [Vicinamibacterales bacterium]